MAAKTISVIGALNYDLIMIADHVPDGGESLQSNEYHEALGGKGANSAVAAYRTCHHALAKARHATATYAATNPDATASTTTATMKQGFQDPQLDIKTHPPVPVNVRMIGAVGDDNYGQRFKSELIENGVDCSGLVTVQDTRSGICFVIVETFTRENRCLFTLGATESWTKEHFQTIEQLGGGTRPDLCVAQMEIDKEVVEQMIETAGKANVDFVLNAAPANPITECVYRYVTHLLVNESEAAIMSGRDPDEVSKDSWDTICQEFLDRGVQNVVITLGNKGAYYANQHQRGHAKAYEVEVLDTTGAGDTFTGAYSSDYLQQKEASSSKAWDIERAVNRANKAAAITVTKMGAQAGIPWSDEIDACDAPLRDPDFVPIEFDFSA
ncbi:hypothetical protein KC318_g4502 [Hortaea werneckii]|nr:hypothetical protein KC334_g1513 [Hortaea werneckii]KAI7012768.1 hypothetical protein KC355_g5309 [Hortaea werneckii]KAI7669675.1 hypothetical protein KC318_g4502 [Hortaea werneckii]